MTTHAQRTERKTIRRFVLALLSQNRGRISQEKLVEKVRKAFPESKGAQYYGYVREYQHNLLRQRRKAARSKAASSKTTSSKTAA